MVVAFYAFTPEQLGKVYRCPIARWTGLQCPTCGTTRALWSLLHLRFAEAFAYNPFVFLLVPVMSVILMVPGLRTDRRVWSAILLLAVVWGICRNLI